MVQESAEKFCTRIETETEFAKKIVKAIRDGFAFVPFVGAGFSVAAGIPATPAMFRYLEYCMLAAFGLVPERRKNPWAPRQEPWPTLASWRDDDLPTSGRIRQIWQQALGDNSTDLLLRESFGALADWRSALRFFSRIDSVVPSGDQRKPATVHLGASDPSIIDSFFRALMENRRPALSHKMLHALSTALRCDLLLTTNFDDLIERAFLDAGSPLSVYEVPSHDPLPTAGLVLRERTLIKLHGGKFWLRADDTLDESPSREDVRNFLGYLAGRPLRSNPQAVGDDLTAANESTALLVCGLSASDQRIKHLLAYALAWMSELTIYWLGYSESDAHAANEVARLACEYSAKRTELSDSNVTPGKMRERIFVHLCPDAGLFCLRLFQEQAHSLPPSGAIFPALWKLASPPDFFAPTGYDRKRLRVVANIPNPKNPADRFAKQLLQLRMHIHSKFRAYAHGDLHATLPPVLIEVGNGASGGLSLAQQLHLDGNWGRPEPAECSQGFPDPVHAIWFDLVDVVQPAGFFLRLSLMIASACGENDPISRLNIEDYYGSPQDYKRFCESIAHSIARLTRESGAMWLVAVNAKESPGCNSLFHHEGIFSEEVSQPPKAVNRWQDSAYSIYAPRFADTIEYLVEKERLPLQFVFVSHSVNINDHESDSHLCLRALWTRFGSPRQQDWAIRENYLQFPSVKDIIDKTISRIRSSFKNAESNKQAERQAIFQYLIAYMIAIFRIARYPVALREIMERLDRHSREDDVGRQANSSSVNKWLESELDVYVRDPRNEPNEDEELGIGLVRQKQGGFLWMHLEERRALLVELHKMLSEMNDGALKQTIAELTLRLHWYVARWYGRLLLSSLDPLAVSQAIDHTFRGLEFAAAYCDTLFVNEERKLGRLPIAMARHACHLLGVAEPLFGRRLSDQFANLALESLLQYGLVSVRMLVEKMKSKKGFVHLADLILAELNPVEIQLLQMYTTLQRRSGRFNVFLGKPGTQAIHDRMLEIRKRLLPAGDVAPTKETDKISSMTNTSSAGLLAIELDLANCLLCSRCYDLAATSLFKILTRINPELAGLKQPVHPTNDRKALVEFADKIRDWSAATEVSRTRPSEDTIVKTIEALEKLMYLEMHRSQSKYLARDAARRLFRDRDAAPVERTHDMLYEKFLKKIVEDIRMQDSEEFKEPSTPKQVRCQLLQNALIWGETGLALLRHLTIADGQRVYVDNVRLRTHSALCEGLMAAHGNPDEATARMIKAKRLLAEAQAYLDEFPLKHAGKLRAVFELRCAEISILEASIARRSPAPEGNPDNTLTPSPRLHHPYRIVLAHVYDSLRAVKRAEVVLEEYRKSRWWWWILLVLKVKACEYLYDVRLRRLKAWAVSIGAKRATKKRNEEGLRELLEQTRQLPPFAQQFLRNEIYIKVIDAQMADPMFLARIVHSFRMICRNDMEFEEIFRKHWPALGGGPLPGGRGDRPRVRLGHARSTLRRLTERLESIIPGTSEVTAMAATNENLDADKLDADTMDYAKLVILQANWDVEHEILWNR